MTANSLDRLSLGLDKVASLVDDALTLIQKERKKLQDKAKHNKIPPHANGPEPESKADLLKEIQSLEKDIKCQKNIVRSHNSKIKKLSARTRILQEQLSVNQVLEEDLKSRYLQSIYGTFHGDDGRYDRNGDSHNLDETVDEPCLALEGNLLVGCEFEEKPDFIPVDAPPGIFTVWSLEKSNPTPASIRIPKVNPFDLWRTWENSVAEIVNLVASIKYSPPKKGKLSPKKTNSSSNVKPTSDDVKTFSRKRKVIEDRGDEDQSENPESKRPVRSCRVRNLLSDFRLRCQGILADPPDLASLETEPVNLPVVDWETKTELAITMSSDNQTSQMKQSFIFHTFRKESVIVLQKRVKQAELEENLQDLLKCKNLRTLALWGIGNLPNRHVIEKFLSNLASSCPFIEHFIVKDEDIPFLHQYVHLLGNDNNLRTLELNNEINNEESTDNIMEIIDTCPKLSRIFILDPSKVLLELVLPKVSTIVAHYVTEELFVCINEEGKSSNLESLSLSTFDIKIDKSRIEGLHSTFPFLKSIELSSSLEFINRLSIFHNLEEVVWDADCFGESLDPLFPVDFQHAKSALKIEDDHTTVGERKQRLQCQNSLNEFFSHCGSRLKRFTLFIRNRYRKDLFKDLKVRCPKLEHLKIVYHANSPAYFEPQSFALPSLTSLFLDRVTIKDNALVILLDNCPRLTTLYLESAKSLSPAAVPILEAYVNTQYLSSQEISEADAQPLKKFYGKISTEGDRMATIRRVSPRLDIEFAVTKRCELSDKVRYKY